MIDANLAPSAAFLQECLSNPPTVPPPARMTHSIALDAQWSLFKHEVCPAARERTGPDASLRSFARTPLTLVLACAVISMLLIRTAASPLSALCR